MIKHQLLKSLTSKVAVAGLALTAAVGTAAGFAVPHLASSDKPATFQPAGDDNPSTTTTTEEPEVKDANEVEHAPEPAENEVEAEHAATPTTEAEHHRQGTNVAARTDNRGPSANSGPGNANVDDHDNDELNEQQGDDDGANHDANEDHSGDSGSGSHDDGGHHDGGDD